MSTSSNNNKNSDERPVIDLKVLIEKLARFYNLDEKDVIEAKNKISKMMEEKRSC